MDNKKMEPASNLDEAPKDPGALTTHHSYTDKDFEGHRAHTVYVGLHVPSYRRRGHHRRHRHHHAKNGSHKRREDGMPTDYVTDLHRPVTPPAERVHFILGEEEDGMHESHPLFSEMEELHVEGDEMEWRETARWIKFEEDVEEGGNRWSKPHVATISLHSLFELRSCILNGTVMLDMEAASLDQIADLVLENMINAGHLQADLRERIKEALLRRHRHQHEPRHDKGEKGSRLPLIRSLADIGRNSSKSMFSSHSAGVMDRQSSGIWYVSSPSSPTSLKDWKPDFIKLPIIHEPEDDDDTSSSPSNMHPEGGGNGNSASNGAMPHSPSSNSLQGNQNLLSIGGNHQNGGEVPSNPSSADLHKTNHPFMKKIPPGAEASNILVGEVEFLERAVIAFVRLGQACHLGDLTEVPVPTRFLFVLLGPTGNLGRYHEIGRAMATLMSDEVFHDVAYKAKSRQDLLAGVDEFLDAVTVLPPGAWDPSIRIEPPNQLPSQESRKKAEQEVKHTTEEIEDEEEKERQESGLKRTGRIFGGLVNDIKRKKPFYLSDFKDAFALQTVASIFFLYFACIAPIITFGGLLEDATGQNIAAMESLLSGAICGIIYGLFSGQPLTILGSTGPVLVFETILYDFCRDNGLDYLPLRLWIGLWTSGILMVLVATDASALVCYITRFTEENFATLISLIFIYKAIEKVLNINTKYPLLTDSSSPINLACVCTPPNGTDPIEPNDMFNWTAISSYECQSLNGTMTGIGCEHVPNVFLFSVILFAGTFSLSVFLKNFKTSSFFPTNVRQFVSDFAVVIAIVSMTCTDALCGISTPKLQVPAEFKPTSPHRGWLVPWFKNNPWWTALAAFLPALLCTILIFMDQQITAVIINRKENKLKKGCGYHLDLFVLSLLIAICSILGLPWFVAATVLAMTHVNSLKMESESAAPGEKPQFLGVREQRCSQVIINSMIGLSVFFTPVLRCIPMPVLYGVFLYMGVSSLQGSQFFDRILIMFMPQKYQPDYMFLRHVPTIRCHIFTFIQLTCLVLLWIIKSYKPTSIAFPLMLVVMIGVRKCLDFFFTQRELKILDDVMPEPTRRKREEDQLKLEEEENNKDNCAEPQGIVPNASSGNVAIPLANGNILKVPVERFKEDQDQSNINITEQLSKTQLWQSIDQQVQITPKSQPKTTTISVPIPASKKKKRGSKKDAMNDEERKRLSTMAEDEEDEDDCGITIQIDEPTPNPSAQPSPSDTRRRSKSISSNGSHNETSV